MNQYIQEAINALIKLDKELFNSKPKSNQLEIPFPKQQTVQEVLPEINK